MIVTCTCQHSYQDSKHGLHQRVANPMKNRDQARCTVCLKVHTVQKAKDTDSKNLPTKKGS